MIGLLLLFFIARAYSELAFEYDKSRWAYGILGVLMYYAGTFVGGFGIGIISVLIGIDIAEENSNIVLTLLCVPFGLLLCWGCYKLLGSYWEKQKRVISSLQETLAE